MNHKAVIVSLAVGTGTIAAAWVMLDGPGSTDPRPPLAGDGPSARGADLFDSTPLTPSPARFFFDSANGSSIPADARQQISGWISMMDALLDRMDEFDVNGDGKLSELEKVAMGMKLRKEWLAEHDLDGDGKMSGAEWEEFQRALFEQTPEGQRLLRRFDLDGDGMLSEDEQAALDAHLQAQEQERRAQEQARMDTDGDGRVSDDERQAARRQEREWWQNQVTTAEDNFDSDGDGDLNIEESRDAWDAWVEYQAIDDFITRYDADGDRSMGPVDYDRFLSNYDRRNPIADVNNDGQINIEDINAFRDLVLRSRSI